MLIASKLVGYIRKRMLTSVQWLGLGLGLALVDLVLGLSSFFQMVTQQCPYVWKMSSLFFGDSVFAPCGEHSLVSLQHVYFQGFLLSTNVIFIHHCPIVERLHKAHKPYQCTITFTIFSYNNPSNVMQCLLFSLFLEFNGGRDLSYTPSSNIMLNMMHERSSFIPHTQESQMANHIMIDLPFVHHFDGGNQD